MSISDWLYTRLSGFTDKIKKAFSYEENEKVVKDTYSSEDELSNIRRIALLNEIMFEAEAAQLNCTYSPYISADNKENIFAFSHLSVTGFISKLLAQPRGGIIAPSKFTKHLNYITDLPELNPANLENIHGSLVGSSVDYLTRLCNGASTMDAFSISIKGGNRLLMSVEDKALKSYIEKSIEHFIEVLTNSENKLSDDCIISAIKLVTLDVFARTATHAPLLKSFEDIRPNQETIENIRTMTQRTLLLLNKHNTILFGLYFIGGYTHIVSTADADYLCDSTLLDLKVKKADFTSSDTAQVLIYYILAKQAYLANPVEYAEYANIDTLALYNARKNILLTYNITENDNQKIAGLMLAMGYDVCNLPNCELKQNIILMQRLNAIKEDQHD